jgi:hypothetical protein
MEVKAGNGYHPDSMGRTTDGALVICLEVDRK